MHPIQCIPGHPPVARDRIPRTARRAEARPPFTYNKEVYCHAVFPSPDPVEAHGLTQPDQPDRTGQKGVSPTGEAPFFVLAFATPFPGTLPIRAGGEERT
jgi:hypothetical protein